MPPFFFRANPLEAGRIMDRSPNGSAKIYDAWESQDWMRAAMADIRAKYPKDTIRIILANEVVDAALVGDALMSVTVDSREALEELAANSGVTIHPYN